VLEGRRRSRQRPVAVVVVAEGVIVVVGRDMVPLCPRIGDQGRLLWVSSKHAPAAADRPSYSRPLLCRLTSDLSGQSGNAVG